MGILQTVFELTNVDGVKVLTILGMKFKLMGSRPGVEPSNACSNSLTYEKHK